MIAEDLQNAILMICGLTGQPHPACDAPVFKHYLPIKILQEDRSMPHNPSPESAAVASTLLCMLVSFSFHREKLARLVALDLLEILAAR